MGDEQEFTVLLGRIGSGDQRAWDALFRIAYDELRRRAHFQRRDAPASETVGTTVLVHETFLKLAGAARPQWDDRRHFFRVAARAMRQILLDQARRRVAQKRGGGEFALDIDELQVGVETDQNQLVALDQALSRLEAENPRLAEVVELRFFAGLSVDETAAALGVSERTVKRDWRLARAFLHSELDEEVEGA